MYYIANEQVLVTDNAIDWLLYNDDIIIQLAYNSVKMYEIGDLEPNGMQIEYRIKCLLKYIFQSNAPYANIVFVLDNTSELYNLIKCHSMLNTNMMDKRLCYLEDRVYMHSFNSLKQLHDHKTRYEEQQKKIGGIIKKIKINRL